MGKKYELTVPALAIKQGKGHELYSFAMDGKKLPWFTTVSRVKRDREHRLNGYQRAESIAHIRTITNYLETPDAMLPNALVVAFDRRVRFEPVTRRRKRDEVQTGNLVIPVDTSQADHDKPGWVVDGQQRCAAIRDADVERFPVYVTAFITDSVAEQRSQFILVNSTKPLPKGLIHELLPATPKGDLPIMLLKRRYPAFLLDRLNYDDDSPLFRAIRTPTTAEGRIKDNSVLRMLASSIEDGALNRYFDSDTGEGNTESMLRLLKNFWRAVAEVFPEAWEQSPRHSRLVHGVGVMSVGALMDEITYRLGGPRIPSPSRYVEQLEVITDICRWTNGTWEFQSGQVRKWNELQNIPRDIRLLTDHLVRTYRARAGSRSDELRRAA
jgi:DGQHR domain-containing protein